MKLSTYWLGFLSLMVIGIMFLIWVLLYVIPQFPNDIIKTISFISTWFLLIVVNACLIYAFYNGDRYVEKVFIPIADIKIVIYNNIYIVSYKSYAWAVPTYYEKILKQKELKITRFYNRNKELTHINPDIPRLIS